MPFISVDTSDSAPVDLYYQDCGAPDARPVILIHGWPLSHRMWEYQINALTEAGYRCIAYDRRGFGESSKPWEGYDYDTLSGDLQALMTRLDLRDAVLVGFSMGGGEVARYFGRFGNDRVSAAMLIGAVPPFLLKTDDNPDGVDAQVFEDMKAGILDQRVAFLEGFGQTFVNWSEDAPTISRAQLQYNHTIASFAAPHATLRCITAFGQTDFRHDLPKISVPTLIIHGDADQIVPAEVSAQRSHEMISGSRLEMIGGAPHGLNFTHREELHRLMLDFLDQLS
ncbi:alpha/beta fold hydrolase [Kushneria phosphatilytica]|uniref:Alpha/beta hydrolase n=1 Tax=Kushneria phosphatilytica TaxID=657387 RepID=A0A1S1P238_9GAMM|nr:alpha/beta hydrolase [Kushneria phosphatilytica]OHV12860.1 alpha/beta hydrolase [Kushneria phosphatilytica]QEL10718.1 alpha/beta hydrolase [Kushneria phosphatilytica]